MLFLKQTVRRLLLLMSLFGLKVKQLNSARRQIRRNGDEGGGGSGGGVGGTQPCGRVLRLQVMRTTKTPASFIVPLPWGRTRVLAEPFLISPQRLAGWIGQD